MTWLEALGSGRTHVSEAEMLLRLVSAVVFGAAIGLDRELRERSAGLRTHMLTALAAAMFTIIAFEIFHAMRQLEDNVGGDPIRLIQAVTAGVSFLAAGTIINGRGGIHGLTTGAGMWLAGAVGTACGGGYYFVALAGTVLAIAVIVLLEKFEQHALDTKSKNDS